MSWQARVLTPIGRATLKRHPARDSVERMRERVELMTAPAPRLPAGWEHISVNSGPCAENGCARSPLTVGLKILQSSICTVVAMSPAGLRPTVHSSLPSPLPLAWLPSASSIVAFRSGISLPRSSQ
jgi:hypothetical protein